MDKSMKFFLVIIFSFLGVSTVTAQVAKLPATRQKAMEAFARKNYDESASLFSELLEKYPSDRVYMYYTGKSLVMNSSDLSRAIKLLTNSHSGSTIVQEIPYDSWFYLGRAMQMTGDYNGAFNAYDRFGVLASRKEFKSYEVKRYMEECSASTGMITNVEPVVETKAPEDNLVEDIVEMVPVRQPEPISDSLNKALDKALVNSVITPAALPETKVVPPAVIVEAPVKQEVVAGEVEQKETVEAVPKQVVVEKRIEPVKETVRVFSLFEVKSTADSKGNIVVNEKPYAGLIYRIQLAVFRNPVAVAHFKGLFPLNGLKADGSDLTYYYAGQFRRHSDAEKALVAVRGNGFKDAFIVSTVDNKVISMERGRVLEEEWGKKPLYEEVITANEKVTEEPPLLVFRVEVIRSEKPLSRDIVDGLNRLSESRGMDIVTTLSGESIYLVGKFLTFESAAEYSDIIVRNGYRQARVVAYLGAREIPVETAKQLFEKR